jgi:metallo-beta-lactamase family protein
LFGFSAHADNRDLLKWIESINKQSVKKVFLVHGEESIIFDFKDILEEKGYNVMVPEWKKEYNVN